MTASHYSRSENVSFYRHPKVATLPSASPAARRALAVLLDGLDGRASPCARDPERWHSEAAEAEAQAVAECGRCPVRAECVQYGAALGARTGTWGGQALGQTGRRTVRADGTRGRT